MIRFIIKVFVSAILIATISEIGKRNSLMAAVYASLPLTTILAMVWLYLDSGDLQKTTSLSWNVLLAFIPSCVFLVAFPLLVKVGVNFWISMAISGIITAFAYWVFVLALKHYGINI